MQARLRGLGLDADRRVVYGSGGLSSHEDVKMVLQNAMAVFQRVVRTWKSESKKVEVQRYRTSMTDMKKL